MEPPQPTGDIEQIAGQLSARVVKIATEEAVVESHKYDKTRINKPVMAD
jgi:hypothetical protein